MVDTFLDMAADSLVPVLSGTHSNIIICLIDAENKVINLPHLS